MLAPNGILSKGDDEKIDMITILEQGRSEVYLASNTHDLPIGAFNHDQYKTPDPSWWKLEPKQFLPMLKRELLTNQSLRAGGAWQTNRCQEIYDEYISQEERVMPLRVRKIMDTDAAIKALECKTVKFTQPVDFNDFQEGSADFDDLYKYANAATAHMNRIKDFYVTSFGEGPWNYLALSIYGNSGNGVLFVYNTEKICKCFQQNLVPVRYVFAPPHLNHDESVSRALHFKHIPWEYEKEWRLILHKDEIDSMKLRDMGSYSALLPLDMSALDFIYIGPRVSQEDSRKIHELAQSLNNPRLEVFNINYPINQYNVIVPS